MPADVTVVKCREAQEHLLLLCMMSQEKAGDEVWQCVSLQTSRWVYPRDSLQPHPAPHGYNQHVMDRSRGDRFHCFFRNKKNLFRKRFMVAETDWQNVNVSLFRYYEQILFMLKCLNIGNFLIYTWTLVQKMLQGYFPSGLFFHVLAYIKCQLLN